MFWEARCTIYVYDGKTGCREMGISDRCVRILCAEGKKRSSAFIGEHHQADTKFSAGISYYNGFEEYLAEHNLRAMEKLFAEYVNKRLNSYLVMLDMY